VPNYRRYFIGTAVSVIGSWMQRVGQDWLVLKLTHSAVALSLTQTLQFLPILVLGVWGGVIIDRVDTRKLLIITQSLQAVLAGLLALVSVIGYHPLAAVYILCVALGLVTVFDTPARQTFVNELVGPEDIVNALTLNGTLNNVGRLVGPAIAGAAISALGVSITFGVNAVSFIAVLVQLALIDQSELHKRIPIPRARGQAVEGLRYVWHNRQLRAVMLVVICVSIFGQNFRVLLPLLATDTFHGNAQTYGWLTAMLGLGAIIGAMVTAGFPNATSRALALACLLFAVANLCASVSPTLLFAFGSLVILGSANIVINTFSRTLLQVGGDVRMIGRVMAIYSVVFLGSTPIGAPIAGAICEFAGVRVAFVAAGVLSVAPIVWVLPRLLRRETAVLPATP
jgi:MFS family permease